jgi:hypothetical protein
MSDKKITQEELVAMFGEDFPMEAIELLFSLPVEIRTEDICDQLRVLAIKHHDKQTQIMGDAGESDNRFVEFQRESDSIEELHPSDETLAIEAKALKDLCEGELTIANIETYVKSVQPDAFLRTNKGDEVSIMGFDGLTGGLAVSYALQEIIDGLPTTEGWYNYVRYELLHPFSDGNGRSGRAVWLYYMLNVMGGWQYVSSLGFLDTFHRQILYAFSRQSMARTPEEVSRGVKPT